MIWNLPAFIPDSVWMSPGTTLTTITKTISTATTTPNPAPLAPSARVTQTGSRITRTNSWQACLCHTVFVRASSFDVVLLAAFGCSPIWGTSNSFKMNKKKSLHNILSARHLVATNGVTDCNSETVLCKCLFCDDAPKQKFHAQVHT